MTTITIKPARENAKARKYRKTGEHFAMRDERRALAKRIDSAFTKLSEGCSKRVISALNSTEYKMNMRERGEVAIAEDAGSRCLPNVWRYQAGHRTATGENGTTCIGRQKIKLSSKPLM